MAGSTSLPDHVSRILVAEDWEGDVRHTFHRLYVVEDKALPQAMTEMVELLGFQATYVLTFSINFRIVTIFLL